STRTSKSRDCCGRCTIRGTPSPNRSPTSCSSISGIRYIEPLFPGTSAWLKPRATESRSSLLIGNPRELSRTWPSLGRCSRNRGVQHMVKAKGLGRGLDALLSGDDVPQQEQLISVALSQLRPGKYQPRTQMDAHAITELAESIKSQGVIQP